MRYIKYLFLAAVALVLTTLALANRDPVSIRLLPDELASLFGFNIAGDLPLFLIILGGLVAGIFVGFVWEWFREMKIRSQASTHRRDKEKLEREVKRLSASKPKSETEEVLALLDADPAR